jgi:hypothetical protein
VLYNVALEIILFHALFFLSFASWKEAYCPVHTPFVSLPFTWMQNISFNEHSTSELLPNELMNTAFVLGVNRYIENDFLQDVSMFM